MGRHVILEVYNVDFNLLNQLEPLLEVVRDAINSVNMTILNIYTYKFTPQGLTILFCLAESHVSLHTFPEHNCISFDAYTCGDNNPKLIAIELLKYLKSSNYNMRELTR
jgi:S-adenosylmethionine decarboxylase